MVLIAEGNVYEMRDLLQIISGYDVLYEVKPSYPLLIFILNCKEAVKSDMIAPGILRRQKNY